jgi:hypothetical protein
MKDIKLTNEEINAINELIEVEIDANDYENLSEVLKVLLNKLKS